MTTSGISSVCASVLLSATLLPYSGPSICKMLGQMGNETDEVTLTSRSDGAALSAPDSMVECCSFEGCGVPQAGPTAFSIPSLYDDPVLTMAPRTAQPTPPQASPDPLVRPPRA